MRVRPQRLVGTRSYWHPIDHDARRVGAVLADALGPHARLQEFTGNPARARPSDVLWMCAEIERLCDALAIYGSHAKGCGEPCSCGFDQVLGKAAVQR